MPADTPRPESGTDPIRLQILRMIEAGQLTAEEAARLLAALDANPEVRALRAGRWLRVQVTDGRTGQVKTGVNLPLGLIEKAAEAGLKLGAFRWAESLRLDPAEVLAAIRAGATGTIVTHEDPATGDRLDVLLE